MFHNFDVNNDSFFSYFSFLRTLMYQFFAAIGRVAALRRESQLGATHFCWKNTYVFIYFFSWFFLKCLDGLLEPEIPGFRPWGARGAHFRSSGADNWSQKRIVGFIISSFMMELYVWGCVYAYTHMHKCIYVYADSAPPLEKSRFAYNFLIQIAISGPGRPLAQIPGSGHPSPYPPGLQIPGFCSPSRKDSFCL